MLMFWCVVHCAAILEEPSGFRACYKKVAHMSEHVSEAIVSEMYDKVSTLAWKRAQTRDGQPASLAETRQLGARMEAAATPSDDAALTPPRTMTSQRPRCA